MWLRLQQRRRGPAAAAGLVQWCSFQQAAVSTSPPPAARPRPGQMIAIFLKMNKIPTDGSTFSRFIWDESRSWVAGGGQGWTLPGSGALLRHGHTIYRHTDARQPGLGRRVQTVGSDFMFIIISLTFIISKEIKVRNLKLSCFCPRFCAVIVNCELCLNKLDID